MAATKFTPDTRASITASLRAGGSFAGACREVGLRQKTAEGWLTRGRREDEGPYAEFAAAVDEAREVVERASLSREDFEWHLAKAVRAGSVQAMKLWAELNVKKGGDSGEPDLFDDLAAARWVAPESVDAPKAD